MKQLVLFLSFYFCFQSVMGIQADIVVAADGTGDFTKIQDAINAVPSNQKDRRTVIYLKNGLYDTEKLLVPSDKQNITLIGESRDQTIISYHIYDCANTASGNKCPAEDALKWVGDVIRTSATLTIAGEGFRAENLTIRNTAGPVGQALAITVTADKVAFINCNLLGYQDTIYLWTAGKRSYFQNCLVLGRTDYIYGAGIGYFQGCEIRSYGGGYITAPSTPKSQSYGFVFNDCDLTYTTGSPRAGDDGVKFRLGRPWHEYPKVTWLNCDITGMLNPQGWGDTWNMEYAATSTDLHLYEYNNTGPGADMSQRAGWVGLRALSQDEAQAYTRERVLNGSDAWSPWADAPLSATYEWDGGGTSASWLEAGNWNPDGVPAAAQAAYIRNGAVAEADGGVFAADLFLQSSALNIKASGTASYLSVEKGKLIGDAAITLNGKLATKDSVIIETSSTFTVAAQLQGVHVITKTGTGSLVFTADNSNYSGKLVIDAGSVQAATANALGKSSVVVNSGAWLQISHPSALSAKSSLSVSTGGGLLLNADITLSEFYIDGVLQAVGVYTATSHPNVMSGVGSLQVGRPSVFKMMGGAWDVAANYSPALLPLEGETVLCEGEMETAATPNKANVTFVDGKGKLRLRGVHTSTGTLTFEGNQRISYATGGTGFTLTAPLVLKGDISLEMNSSSVDGSTLVLNGSIAGNVKVTPKNTRAVANSAVVVLGGNNEAFAGSWDLTAAAAHAEGSVGITGTSENAFGTASIRVGAKNKVQFDHERCVTSSTDLTLLTGATAIVNKPVTVGRLTLGAESFTSGNFTATTHPLFIKGAGSITVGPTAAEPVLSDGVLMSLVDGRLLVTGPYSLCSVYRIDGSFLGTINPGTTFRLPHATMCILKIETTSGTKYTKIGIN